MNEENNNLEKQLSDVRGTLNAALHLIADIRRAVGDPTGNLMQDELVAHCGEVYKRAGMYNRLNESLAKNKRLFANEFAERVIEQQKKRIHQLETELIEAKCQLRQKSPWDGVSRRKLQNQPILCEHISLRCEPTC